MFGSSTPQSDIELTLALFEVSGFTLAVHAGAVVRVGDRQQPVEGEVSPVLVNLGAPAGWGVRQLRLRSKQGHFDLVVGRSLELIEFPATALHQVPDFIRNWARAFGVIAMLWRDDNYVLLCDPESLQHAGGGSNA